MHTQSSPHSRSRRRIVPVWLALAVALALGGVQVTTATSLVAVQHAGGPNGIAFTGPQHNEVAGDVSRSVGLMEGAPAAPTSMQLNDVLDDSRRAGILIALGGPLDAAGDDGAVALVDDSDLSCRVAC